MTASDVKKELMKKTNGQAFITKRELASLMGIKDPKNVSKYVEGLERISGKYYFVPDVATSLIQHATM